jgi:hypothetical protein
VRFRRWRRPLDVAILEPLKFLEGGMEASKFIDESEARVGVCEDCGTNAPASDTNYTVVTSRYGWRLTRVSLVSEQGDPPVHAVQWRCPSCWQRYQGRAVARAARR